MLINPQRILPDIPSPLTPRRFFVYLFNFEKALELLKSDQSKPDQAFGCINNDFFRQARLPAE